MFVTESTAADTQSNRACPPRHARVSAMVAWTLAALLLGGVSANAHAQSDERNHFARLSIGVQMTATPLVPGAPASVTIDRILHGSMYSSVALGHGAERQIDAIEQPDAPPFPWQTSAAAGTARSSAYASDALGGQVELFSQITGDGWPYNQASTQFDSRTWLTLSGNSTLTVILRLIGDGTALQGVDFGNYSYRYTLSTSEEHKSFYGEWPGAPQDETITLSVTNNGSTPMTAEWWISGATLVSVASVVPEPQGAAMYLAGLALLFAGMIRQRRRHVAFTVRRA